MGAGSCPTLGFRVAMALGDGADAAKHDELLGAWNAFVEHRGLYSAGDGGPERMELVVASEAAQATESDRAAARAWLASRRELAAWQVGDLVDLDQEA
jgi:uncharacterized protein YggL (DUF469 family)